jgi:hypothetical protein
MRMKDWLLAGHEPAFATVDDWITDLIGRAGGEETAAYAMHGRDDGRDGVRILIATDIGLFDFFWYRPDAVADRVLTGRHVEWRDVRGMRLESETRLNPETMLRREPAWQLTIDEPSLTIADPPSEEVLLDFWSACRDGIRGGE